MTHVPGVVAEAVSSSKQFSRCLPFLPVMVATGLLLSAAVQCLTYALAFTSVFEVAVWNAGVPALVVALLWAQAPGSKPADAPLAHLKWWFSAAGLLCFGISTGLLYPADRRGSNIVALCGGVALAVTAELLRSVMVLSNVRGYRVPAVAFAVAAVATYVSAAAGIPGSGNTQSVTHLAC